MLCLLITQTAQPWGDTGHEIICEIAFQELSPRAQAEVTRLIQRDRTFRSFAKSCTWPDHPRQRGAEHFINLPRAAVELTSDRCPLANKCVLTAIKTDHAGLAGATTDAKKLAALKFLGHWVGDVHQPLPVSFKDDRGGNAINGRGRCAQDLHTVWDTCIIERKLGTDIHNIAKELRRHVTEDNRTQWNNTSVRGWANESFTIATSPDVEYCVPKANACWYQPHNRALDLDEVKKVVTVNDAYMDTHLPTVRLRLTQAGIRLDRLLNQALGGE